MDAQDAISFLFTSRYKIFAYAARRPSIRLALTWREGLGGVATAEERLHRLVLVLHLVQFSI